MIEGGDTAFNRSRHNHAVSASNTRQQPTTAPNRSNMTIPSRCLRPATSLAGIVSMSIVLVAGSTATVSAASQPEPILDERVMEISRVSAKLAALAYESSPQEQLASVLGASPPGNLAMVSASAAAIAATIDTLPNYINFYTNEPDQAIVARYGGRCYISFRGTEVNADDWSQNIDIGDRLIYRNGDTAQPSCESRRGFGDFLQKPEVVDGREGVLSCVESCVGAGSDPEDCLVITGHSQGGATATIASILLYDQLPTVITFGQPPAVDPNCEWIPSERFYRYVNSKVEAGEDDDLAFDAVPFSPTFISGSAHYGYLFMLGDNDPDGKTSSIKLMGYDDNGDFNPDLVDLGIIPHKMEGTEYSYEQRILSLIQSGEFPVPIVGFSPGAICEDGYRELCASERCKENICQAKIEELCVKGSCENDYECASGKCIWRACAPGPGRVEDGCPCARNGNCANGDCGISFFSFDWACRDDGAIPAGDISSFPLTTVAATEAEAKADVNAASKRILCFRMISFVSLTELFLSLL